MFLLDCKVGLSSQHVKTSRRQISWKSCPRTITLYSGLFNSLPPQNGQSQIPRRIRDDLYIPIAQDWNLPLPSLVSHILDAQITAGRCVWPPIVAEITPLHATEQLPWMRQLHCRSQRLQRQRMLPPSGDQPIFMGGESQLVGWS